MDETRVIRNRWKAQDVAEFLQCSKSQVYNMTTEYRLPHIKIGKMLRFDQNEIIEWEKQYRIGDRV